MQVDDKVTYVGIVDSLLCPGLPGDIGAGIVRKDANDVDLVEILELAAAELGEFAAEDEVKQLFFCGWRFCGHESVPGR